MYYKYYDWISMSTFEYDGLIKNILIWGSACRVYTNTKRYIKETV